MDQNGNVDLADLYGKPVSTALGKNPLEAWGQCLIKLGLVDEILVESAMQAVKDSREESLQEARDKIGKKKSKSKSSTEAQEGNKNDKLGDGVKEETEPNTEVEPIGDLEQQFLDKVASLEAEVSRLKDLDRKATVELADARINVLGNFLCNPFGETEGSKDHQASWMAAAVRKEKSKMGSTGNKRKVVSATDLLERNNTFYNGEVESLVEGLPGSEYCGAYLYQANRGAASASRAWLHEQQLRQERDKQKRIKQTKEAKVKASQQRERELKRKKREDERDARKRQKLEEDEEKKKLRIEERLVRLTVQVEDRLYKEATFQREKVVALMAKNMTKEFNRRRKAAELVSGHMISDSTSQHVAASTMRDLPPLFRQFDEDIVRIWDFITTFGSMFTTRGYVATLPTLDDLQTAVDTLRGEETKMNKVQAISFVTNLAVSLCKPLAAGLTRMLFASLIALNPALQKDFGAAFFNEVNASKTKDGSVETSADSVLLPVSSTTWKEIARISFLSDALGELGYSRQEQAHLLRGYRSAGHPNSKEARRLRRVEDFGIALLRQYLSNAANLPSNDSMCSVNSVQVVLPTEPRCGCDEWLFFVHNLMSLASSTNSEVARVNVSKAIEMAPADLRTSQTIDKLKKYLESIPASGQLGSSAKDGKKMAILILTRCTGETYSRKGAGQVINRQVDTVANDRLQFLEKLHRSKLHRPRMGELQSLELSQKGFKELTRIREEYMSDALRLKEEMKRQELKEAGEDVDEDDEDEDDDEEDPETSEKEKQGVATAKEDTNNLPSNGNPVASPAQTKQDSATESKSNTEIMGNKELVKIGKPTDYDEFCEDIPSAPELIRRCIAVVRALCQAGPTEPFIYPVDPQTNPGYYDMLARPMCMCEVGKILAKAARTASALSGIELNQLVEQTVADFARNIRLIGKNCLAYANAGPTIISAGGEMLRVFERLLLDWVLAPSPHLARLDSLDDDLCVDPHPSDLEATVLLCDGCEGNFNISRLDPPLLEIPKEDWHCPRCISGRWWGHLDPRVGKYLTISGTPGKVTACRFCHVEGEKPSLMYEVELEKGSLELRPLEDVDQALEAAGKKVEKIRCLEAVAESVGYGAGIDHGTRRDLVPVLLNPRVSDAASQVALSSSVFRDSIAAASTLLINDPQEMTATEWVRLLNLLVMKCASSDVVQNVASQMEGEAAERLSKKVESFSTSIDISQVLPEVSDDDDEVPSRQVILSNEAVVVPTEIKSIVAKKGGVDVGANDPMVVEASAVEVVPGTPVKQVQIEGDVAFVEADTVTEEREAKRKEALGDKAKRQRAREDGIIGFCIKNQLRSTVSSFSQDNLSHVVESMMTSKDPGLNFSATRCRGKTCDFCGLSDTALGSNLVRVPNDDEWNSLIRHAARSRRTHTIAQVEIPDRRTKLVAVTIRAGDDLVSGPKCEGHFEMIPDGGMLEFLPRNTEGFQSELHFREKEDLPFVSGSLSAHECCAVSAHNSRKVNLVQKFKDRQADIAEREEGITCGRTLELGRDGTGRSYWIFHSDPSSLFVCASTATDARKWHKYAEPETIASVIVSLGKDPVASELRRAFPKSSASIKSGAWTDLLQKRKFKLPQITSGTSDVPQGNKDEASKDEVCNFYSLYMSF